MICLKCGYVGEMETMMDYDFVPYGNTVVKRSMEYLVCSNCGDDYVEESKPCDVCGEEIAQSVRDANSAWICNDCMYAALEKLRAFRATLQPAEINAIAHLMDLGEDGVWDYAQEDAPC